MDFELIFLIIIFSESCLYWLIIIGVSSFINFEYQRDFIYFLTEFFFTIIVIFYTFK